MTMTSHDTAPPTPDLVNAWVDAEDAADVLGVPLVRPSAIRDIAKSDNWATKGEAGEALYYLIDVQHTARRRARRAGGLDD